MLASTISALFLVTVANGAVITPWRRDALDIKWSAPPGVIGDTQVFFGDEKAYIGFCQPKDILKTLYEQCYDRGICNARSWTVECEGVVGGFLRNVPITVEVKEGQYQSWIKNGLIEAFMAAVETEGIVDKQTENVMSGGGCVGCPWKGTPLETKNMPGSMGITHQNGPGQVPDALSITITDGRAEMNKGVCEAVSTFGGAVAGSLNAAAGGIFSISSLACT